MLQNASKGGIALSNDNQKSKPRHKVEILINGSPYLGPHFLIFDTFSDGLVADYNVRSGEVVAFASFLNQVVAEMLSRLLLSQPRPRSVLPPPELPS